jgi:aldehyde dehydrogenase (NAD+)
MRGLAAASSRLRLSSFSFSFSPVSNPRPFFLSRPFHSSPTMSNVSVQLTAPNGRKYTQPIGLFINNEFVAAKSGDKFASVNPS